MVEQASTLGTGTDPTQMMSNCNPQKFDSETNFIGPVAPASHWTSTEAASTTTPPELMDVETTTVTVDGDKMPQIHWENYDFSNEAVPTFVTWAATEYLKNGSENFLRGCKWSPDGSQIVTNSNDNILRVFNMSEKITENEASSDLEQMSEVALRESGSVYDYAWHPSMASGQPDTCRIATTCSGVPVHLWDSVSGKIVASYKAYDQYDEITSAYSLSFNPSGSRLFGGFKKAIRIFDTDYPGKKCQLVKTCGSKKSWSQPEQPGIISCFAHSPVSDGFFAAGSYTRHIGLYDLRCEGLTCVIEGQRGGITHLMFSPDGNRLFTGARKDNEILCWDMRHLGSIYFSALRDVRTNQRMYFDITRSGRYMTSGNDDGTVTFWDLSRSTEEISGRTYLKPIAQFQAHNDCVNGVSFDPSGNFLASASGQRHFRNFDKADSGSNSSDDDDSDDMPIWDFSLKIWRMPLGKDAG
ncbi:WD repeat-containing, antisense to tp53 [Plakobranchus ocellatus]|uniref:WD repeat-containing protein 79 n=1 Tax=Plakobranchus ocellatus TaxID=259542 RepID=A0AAV4CKB1_9GAST|nr:WD repeat-containing, antisense to tp53 [Plakobranchus ocellatus]